MSAPKKKSSGSTVRKRKRAATSPSAEAMGTGASGGALERVVARLGSFASGLSDVVGTATELTFGASGLLARNPAYRKAFASAGKAIRDAREAAGLTLHELSDAMDLTSPGALDLIENGKAALPFEAMLRLAALVARNDPLPFVMQLARGYNPVLYRTLEQLGLGRVATHVGREREFINILRGRDDARLLSHDQFAAVLKFTAAAFDLALELTGNGGAAAAKPKAKPVAK